MRTDKMSMALGLEARVPFLDTSLVEFALNIPQSIRFKNQTNKYLLKKASRCILPEKTINKRKIGFSTPAVKWLESGNHFKKNFSTLNHLKFSNCSPSTNSVQKWTIQNYKSMEK
jgi:asparagine synthetase B (glutamine-hydrolysing)